MSTFKRLFNVGKGKAKVAQKDVAETDWVDVARNKVADATEAVADAIRPPERADGDEISPRQPSTMVPNPVDGHEDDEPEAPVEAAEEVAEKIEQAGNKPKKRTL